MTQLGALAFHVAGPFVALLSIFSDDAEGWVVTQLNTTLDVDCYRWMDWFHGGLQFQVRGAAEVLKLSLIREKDPMCLVFSSCRMLWNSCNDPRSYRSSPAGMSCVLPLDDVHWRVKRCLLRDISSPFWFVETRVSILCVT